MELHGTSPLGSMFFYLVNMFLMFFWKFLLWPNSIPLCMYTTVFFIHLPLVMFTLFHFQAIMNNASVTNHVLSLGFTICLRYFQAYPRVKGLGHVVILFLCFWFWVLKNCQTVLHNTATAPSHLAPAVCEGSDLSTSSPFVVTVVVLRFPYFHFDVKGHLIMAWLVFL